MHVHPQDIAIAAAAFGASFVEFIEALTVVLAVGATRGWPSALAGSVGAVVVLTVLVLVLGPLLTTLPLLSLQFAVGVLLLLFGMRWLRKAILRAAGVLPLHDEAALYSSERQRLTGTAMTRWDRAGLATAFQIVLIEGLEVVFIVVAVGAGGTRLLTAACIGAGAAFILVVLAGLVLHRPLAQVPENSLKFAVGVMLSALGTFWVGEGARLAWPGGDWSLLALTIAYLLVALAATAACHTIAARPRTSDGRL